MQSRHLLFLAALSMALVLLQSGQRSLMAQGRDAAALSGQVSSAEEGPMEGVLVSARKAGSTVTVTVVSDAKGRYSFPASKLEAGEYTLSIRAVGYDLDGPKSVQIAAQKAATADLKLTKAKDLAAQLSNAEWLNSVPGTEQQKTALTGCTGCHTLQRILKSGHDADEFVQVMTRMAGYAPGSTPLLPQRRVQVIDPINPERFRKQAEWLSTINLSSVSKWEYPLKTMPRPKGRATHVVITEYDLPRRVAQPHDVILDSQGMAWYSDFGSQYIGKLDPKTGKATEYHVPEYKSNFPRGGLDIELDRDGNIWLGQMLQGGVVKFDPKAEKFQPYPLSASVNSDVAQQAMVSPASYHVDGKLWMNNVGIRGVLRMDMASGKFEAFHPYKNLASESGGGMDGAGHSVYGIAADSKNNLFFMDFGSENIGRIDAKTGEMKLLPTPTRNSHPRRGHMDAQDRLWFAEYQADKLAVLDTKTEKYQEWAVPTKWTFPYDAVPDKNGELWTGGMTTDEIVRLDPKSGQATEYLLPKNTNVRRVYVDNTTTPVTFWVGSNHGGSVVKVEPTD